MELGTAGLEGRIGDYVGDWRFGIRRKDGEDGGSGMGRCWIWSGLDLVK